MKTTVTAICAFFITLFSLQAQSYIPNQVIFQFNPNTSQAYRQDLIDEIDGTLLEDDEADPAIIGENVLIEVSFPIQLNGQSIQTEVDLIGNIKRSKTAGLGGTSLNHTLTTTPLTFANFMGQSNLHTYSPIGASCEANYPGGELAGRLWYNQASVKVAILDTGLDPFYPTINQYVTEEVNVLTDDNGGEITATENYNPNAPVALDDNGHGTSVAGVLAGLCNRSGVTPNNLEIMIVKCFDENGVGTLFNMVQAAQMASKLGADVLNISWAYSIDGYDEDHQVLEKLLRDFSNEEDKIIVAGAGNNENNLSTLNLGPANFNEVDNLITVAGVTGMANNCDGSLAGFSNYGTSVDICAPSESMMVPGLNGYWKTDADGTSFAAPIVTTAVVLAWINYYGNPVNTVYFNNVSHPVVSAVVNGRTAVSSLEAYGIEGVVNFQNACSGLYYDESSSPIGGGGGASNYNFLQNIQTNNGVEANSSIGSDKKTINIQAAPNPFASGFNIQLPTSINNRTIELLNIRGQRILIQEVDNQNTTLHFNALDHLPQGVYVLKVYDGKEIHEQLLVKQ